MFGTIILEVFSHHCSILLCLARVQAASQTVAFRAVTVVVRAPVTLSIFETPIFNIWELRVEELLGLTSSDLKL